jgi:hypothetical protein
MVVLAGAAAVAAGATAPRAVDSTGAAVVVAGPSVTGDVVGVVCAAGGPLRFGSTGAVLVTAVCARLADDVGGTVVGVCVAVETSGLAVLVSVTGRTPRAAWAVTGASGCPPVVEPVG